MEIRRPAFMAAVALIALPTLALSQASQEVDYLTDIQPLFATYCYPCHGEWDISREANLRLDKKEFAFADLGDGRHPIVAGESEQSEVFRRMSAATAEDRMPPYSMGVQIPDEKIALVRQWISEGADWQDVESSGEAQPPGLPRVELPDEPFVINTHAVPTVLWAPSIAPSGLLFDTGDAFPEWHGNLFVGGMMTGRIPGTGHLERIVLNENGEEVARESLLAEQRQRIRDVRQGPDGFIYVLTEENNGALLRLEPVSASQ